MMTQHIRKLPVATAVALALATTSSMGWAHHHNDDNEIPFAEANIFFELNNTDGDLGIHALIDGEPWKKLEIEDPREREILDIRLKKRLRRQGLTELFFESAEPPFESDDPEEVTLTPEEFFKRFPEGEYEVEGKTLKGHELESTAMVTHLMPAPPTIVVSGIAIPEGCDEDPLPAVSEPITVSWDPVTTSHPEIGRTGEPIEVVKYELVLDREAPTPFLGFGIDLPPDVTEVELPTGLTEPGDEFKVEVLVREASGNQTATESCFEVDE